MSRERKETRSLLSPPSPAGQETDGKKQKDFPLQTPLDPEKFRTTPQDRVLHVFLKYFSKLFFHETLIFRE